MIILRRGIIPQTSGPFTPASLPGLLFWYKADDPGVTFSGPNVTGVPDASGNGNNLINSGVVPWTATSSYSSLPAFNFATGNNAGLYTSSASAILSVTNVLSVFVVCRYTLAQVAFAGCVSVATGAHNDFDNSGSVCALIGNSGANGVGTFYNNAVRGVSTTSSASNFIVGSIITSTGNTPYLGGSAGSNNSFTYGPINTPTFISVGNRYLGSAAGTTSGWDGPILEVVGCNSDITSYVSQLQTYFLGRGF